MAQSPTHKFGQIIGDVVEESLRKPLLMVAKRHGLYIDWKRPRKARQGRSKVGWTDLRGNRHDLDYVLEAGGTEATIGRPRAFIEIAYRRYTKHSRNKAQEIQGAIAPLCDTYAQDRPFIGVVLAGVFTEGALTQLRSHGFGVIHLPFESIVRAFGIVGIDARFTESTSDAEVRRKVKAWDALSLKERSKVGASLRRIHRVEFDQFIGELERCLSRAIVSVLVVGIHGETHESKSIEAAVAYIESFNEATPAGRFMRYEVSAQYSNGDEIRGQFESKMDAVRFLRSLT